MSRFRVLVSITLAASVHTAAVFAQTDTTFTYQGSLDELGAPADGVFDLDFALFDALSGGTQIGSDVTFTGHSVVDGLFTVELDFGGPAFDNTSRWIEISVNGSELSPRQPVTRAPYSIQTRGIFVDENNNVGIGTNTPFFPFQVETDDAYVAIYGRTTVTDLPPPGAAAFGGYFESENESGIGAYGRANATSGENYGVYGVTFSTAGRGAFGLATASSGVTHGGQFQSHSPDGRGVRGVAVADTGVNYGVYGQTNSAFGYAGAFFGGRNYFEGFVGIGIADPQSELHVAHDAVASGWGVRINSAATTNNQVGMRVSDEGFFDVTNKANIASPSFARLNSAGVWTVVSDRCMKEEIAPLTGMLDRAMSLDPVSYWYNNQDRAQLPDRRIGFIAQDVEPLFPSLVSQGDDLLTMDYNGLGVVAIAALQELKDEHEVAIDQLRAENESLRSRMAQLEALMAEFAVRKGIER